MKRKALYGADDSFIRQHGFDNSSFPEVRDAVADEFSMWDNIYNVSSDRVYVKELKDGNILALFHFSGKEDVDEFCAGWSVYDLEYSRKYPEDGDYVEDLGRSYSPYRDVYENMFMREYVGGRGVNASMGRRKVNRRISAKHVMRPAASSKMASDEQSIYFDGWANDFDFGEVEVECDADFTLTEDDTEPWMCEVHALGADGEAELYGFGYGEEPYDAFMEACIDARVTPSDDGEDQASRVAHRRRQNRPASRKTQAHTAKRLAGRKASRVARGAGKRADIVWYNRETGEVFDTREEAMADAAEQFDFGDPTNYLTCLGFPNDELPYIEVEQEQLDMLNGVFGMCNEAYERESGMVACRRGAMRRRRPNGLAGGRKSQAYTVPWSDGWNKDVEEMETLMSVLDDINKLDYEVRHCVKGAYTYAETYPELGEHIERLGERLVSAGEALEYLEEEDDEEYIARKSAGSRKAQEAFPELNVNGEFCDGYLYISEDGDELLVEADVECWGDNGEDVVDTWFKVPQYASARDIALEIVMTLEFEYGDELGIDEAYIADQLHQYGVVKVSARGNSSQGLAKRAEGCARPAAKKALYGADDTFLRSKGFTNQGFEKQRQEVWGDMYEGYQHDMDDQAWAKELNDGSVLVLVSGYDDGYTYCGWGLFDPDGYYRDGNSTEDNERTYHPYTDAYQMFEREHIGRKILCTKALGSNRKPRRKHAYMTVDNILDFIEEQATSQEGESYRRLCRNMLSMDRWDLDELFTQWEEMKFEDPADFATYIEGVLSE